jgi:hypothetical protein
MLRVVEERSGKEEETDGCSHVALVAEVEEDQVVPALQLLHERWKAGEL